MVAGGSDNHVLLVDVKKSCQMTGKEAEKILDEAGITCNKNAIPFDDEKPMKTSGIRLGTAAMTTRGFKEEEFKQVGLWIWRLLMLKEDPKEVLREVRMLTSKFPIQ